MTFGCAAFYQSGTRTRPPEQHHVDFCVTYAGSIAPNEEGVVAKVISSSQCAVVRRLGSRRFNAAPDWLGRVWLPRSGDSLGAHPTFFHYVNVGPDVTEEEMVTDVYLPLAPR